MLRDQRLRGLHVFAEHRVDQRLVLAAHVALVAAQRRRQLPVALALLVEHQVHAQQPAVGAAAHQRMVELGMGGGPVLAQQGLRQLVLQLGQPRQPVVGRHHAAFPFEAAMADRLGQAELLDLDARLHQVLELGLGDGADPETARGLRHHQRLGLEHRQPLAHRARAHVELLGQRGDVELGVGQQAAADDRGAQVGEHQPGLAHALGLLVHRVLSRRGVASAQIILGRLLNL